jgi:hypothetical protein
MSDEVAHANVLRARLLQRVREARLSGWNPGSTNALVAAAEELERAIRRESVDAALARAKGLPVQTVQDSETPLLRVFGVLEGDEFKFAEELATRFARRGASLTVQKGYGMLLVRATRIDGTFAEANVQHLTAGWCSYRGDVVSIQDLVRRMTMVRKPRGTSRSESGENRPHEDPDGFAKDADRRVRTRRKLPPAGDARRL